MKMIGKIKMLLLVLGIFVCQLIVCSGGNAKMHLQLTSGAMSGTYYVIGAPAARYVNGHSEMINVTPVTGGGIENIRKVNLGDSHFGMATPVEMFKAWNGKAPFKKQMREWRTIGIATRVMLEHTVTLAKYNIGDVQDLKGRIFSIGAAGSGAAAGMLEFLQHTGLAKDIKLRKFPHKDTTPLLLDGKIHAFNRLGSVPSGQIAEVAAQKKIALVDFGPMLEKSAFLKKYPYYQKAVVPGGTYKGEKRDVTFFGMAGYFFAGKDVSEDVVYEFTKLVYSDGCIKSLTMAYKGHNVNRTAPLAGNIAPVHPGAARFWKEIGLQIPEPSLK